MVRIFSRNLPKLNRKAMVKSKTEKAQGLMLSIKEATTTKGKSHLPSLLICQIKPVLKLLVLRPIAKAMIAKAKTAKIINFTFSHRNCAKVVRINWHHNGLINCGERWIHLIS